MRDILLLFECHLMWNPLKQSSTKYVVLQQVQHLSVTYYLESHNVIPILPTRVNLVVWTLQNIRIFYLIKTYINNTKVIA
jgi:hypothetical protein